MTGVPDRLVLVGSVIADLMMSVPALPERGGDVLASATTTQPGGGFNVLAAAARLGLPAALAGHVGDGPFGRLVAAALAAEGIVPLLPTAHGDTGFCVGFVEPDAERTFVTSPGVESRLDAADLAAVRTRAGDAVYLSGYDLCYPVTGPAVAAWCATLADVLVVLDPGPLVAQIPAAVLDPVLRRTDVLTLNAREAGLLGDVHNRVRPSTVVLVRQGAKGCLLYEPVTAAPVHVPAPVVTAVDTTGAGDAHTGALLAARRDTGSWPEAVRVANAAAAIAVTRRGSATGPTRAELYGRTVYTHGHHESVLRSHRWRTAENSAAYLLPHLAPGVTLLDVGSGPGTITVDLATRVAPGRVTALEPTAAALDLARTEAAARGVQTVDFAVGDVHALDLPDGAYDVVHAHQVLQHVADPVRALREMRRVCRPGGLVAARDSDYAAFAWYPLLPELDEWLALYRQVARANGGEPDAGRRLLSWARAAGFTDVTATATTWCFATPEDRNWWGGMWADRILHSDLARQLVTSGAATDADLRRISAAWQEWAAAPDGWLAIPHGEIVCVA